MKLNYIKPEISINDIDLECYLESTSNPLTDEEIQDGDVGSKDRGDFEGEGDSGWGALW